MNGDEVRVSAKELSDKLNDLGRSYLERKRVWRHREALEKDGYLTPLHDVIFKGKEIHEAYRLGAWMHSRITRSLTLAILLALLPWIVALILAWPRVIWWAIPSEFACLMLIGWPVSGWSRIDDDLNEQFLTWLWSKKIESGSVRRVR
jgi:hypothetical protein